MNRGTMILVAVALASAVGAWQMQPKEIEQAAYEDTGELLFPTFTDPTVASSLEVTEWDETSAKPVSFKVEQKAGVWVIPSHNNYPADGTQRMGEAAASFVGARKDNYYGENVNDHAKFGVLDPQGTKGVGDEKGRRITLGDASGKTLVDVIVGKPVEGKQDYYYVRFPAPAGDEANSASRRVYGSKLDLNITTKFADWIEKDLLHVDRDEVVTLISDPYEVDEQAGRVVGSDPLVAHRAPDANTSSGKWTVEEGLPDMEPDEVKIRQIVTAIANIKIVGVRPRPERLTRMELQSKGFFVAGTPEAAELFGNEGEAAITTKDGLRYTLFFGEVTYESGIALSAGTSAPADPESTADASAEPKEDDDEKTASRYMWLNVTYDPAADQTLSAPSLDAEGGEDATTPPTESPENEKKKVLGKDRAAKLSNRFSQWYYVISDSSFKQIHKERSELFKAPKKPEEDK